MGKDLIAELKARAEKGEGANAETVLALIAEVERLEAIVNGYKVSTEEAQEIMGELQAENARLKEENARLEEINIRIEQEGLFYAGRL